MSSRATDRPSRIPQPGRQSGFTLIELLLVMSIFVIVLGMTTISILRPQAQASLAGTVNTIVADLRGQQTKAMSGGTDGGASAGPQGMYIESDRYTLFKGATYNVSDPDNFTVVVTEGVTLSTTFGASQVVFAPVSGEVNGFVGGSNTITTTNNAGENSVITINVYGTVDVQ